MINFASIVLLALLPMVAGAHESSARYIGNEGVLVVSGETKVLFDAFYADSYGNYVLVSDQTREALLAGLPPYDGINAVVVSHVHGDHFSAGPTLEYLRANASVVFFGPMQAVDALKALSPPEDAELLKRLVGFDIKPGQQNKSFSNDDLSLEVVAIPHSGGARMADIDNLVFRVTLNTSPTVLHLGDATTDDSEFNRQQAFWDSRRIDTVFPPYWFYLESEGRAVLENRIRARQVIGIHVPARAMGQGDAWRERLGGDLFTDPGEQRTISPDSH